MSLARICLGLAVLFVSACSQAETPSPGEMAASLRREAPSYDALHRAAAEGPAKNVLWQRETGLAELPLGASAARARQRYGEPNRKRHAREGEWWEYDEVLKLAEEPAEEGDKPVKEQTGTLRMLFVERQAPALDDEATAAVTPKESSLVLSQIQAWAPGQQETRSLIRLLDPVTRLERKYGLPSRKLSMGWGGAEVWLYPAANVAFVISAPQAEAAPFEGAPVAPPTRIVAATIVGL